MAAISAPDSSEVDEIPMTALLPYILQDMPTEVETPETSRSSTRPRRNAPDGGVLKRNVSERGKDFDPDLSGSVLHEHALNFFRKSN